VWLPGQIAKLTDREGEIVQAMAHAIYRDAEVEPHLTAIVDEAWSLIPSPTTSIPALDLDDLNWFSASERFYTMRAARLASVLDALSAIEAGRSLPERVVSRRYAEGLPNVGPGARTVLRAHLERFMATSASAPRLSAPNPDRGSAKHADAA
jgi:hypothetical protein